MVSFTLFSAILEGYLYSFILIIVPKNYGLQGDHYMTLSMDKFQTYMYVAFFIAKKSL